VILVVILGLCWCCCYWVCGYWYI